MDNPLKNSAKIRRTAATISRLFDIPKRKAFWPSPGMDANKPAALITGKVRNENKTN
jgi:hypothetical protein